MSDGYPFLTIGIASYNYARALPRAFEAIKRQDFTDYEVLYCDDGSIDNSIKVIRKLIADNPTMRIRLIEGENLGVAGNKNRIIDNAAGKYLMFCDADDYMLPGCLETLCNRAIETDADEVAVTFENVDDTDKVTQIQEIPARQSKWLWAAFHGTIPKRSVIVDSGIRFEQGQYPDDVWFFTKFHLHSKSAVFIPSTPKYCWVMHDESASARSHTDSPWLGKRMLGSALTILSAAAKQCPSDAKEIEYMALKVYGLAIFYRNASAYSWSEFMSEYKDCRALLGKAFPEYTGNGYAASKDGNGLVRARTAKIIWGEALLERMHLIGVALFCYWAIAHAKRFEI